MCVCVCVSLGFSEIARGTGMMVSSLTPLIVRTALNVLRFPKEDSDGVAVVALMKDITVCISLYQSSASRGDCVEIFCPARYLFACVLCCPYLYRSDAIYLSTDMMGVSCDERQVLLSQTS